MLFVHPKRRIVAALTYESPDPNVIWDEQYTSGVKNEPLSPSQRAAVIELQAILAQRFRRTGSRQNPRRPLRLYFRSY